MNYVEVLEAARACMGPHCKACADCDGKACGSQIPGPGAKGIGDTAILNRAAWKAIRVNMDTLVSNDPVDTSIGLFGRRFAYPFFAGPVGAVKLHYGDKFDDLSYNRVVVRACSASGIAAFTGDGTDPAVMEGACAAIGECDGMGVPTVKPWSVPVVRERLRTVAASGAFAVAMDVDAAGLPFLKGLVPPAGRKSVEDLHDAILAAGRPFIVKGIMTPAGALKARQAGADAIVVSNHGGRVLDSCPPTADVLPSILAALGYRDDDRGIGSHRDDGRDGIHRDDGNDGTHRDDGYDGACNDDAHDGAHRDDASSRDTRMKVLVDGGIRTGADVFKALALGADAVLLARPFVVAAYGAGEEGVKAYIQKIAGELVDCMEMCGATDLDSIRRDMVTVG